MVGGMVGWWVGGGAGGGGEGLNLGTAVREVSGMSVCGDLPKPIIAAK